jgi:uncharacterized protein (TIGR02646 family)
MFRVPDMDLPNRVHGVLSRWQKEIDDLKTYADKVALGKKKFSPRRSKTKTFESVCQALTDMCAGARRCMYCEDSCADEVEHIKPKDIYPEYVFVWENYLYACGQCNTRKNNQYAVFNSTTGRLTEVSRKRNDPVVPPVKGEHVFIDPRIDDPFRFMTLELRQTFYFLPLATLNQLDRQRAQYTIDILQLNNREVLRQARQEAYGSYRARLTEYLAHKEHGASVHDLQLLIDAIKNMSHPTVWLEMQRQSDKIPELADLFNRAPEALNWRRDEVGQ